jgi:hypothetical protein
MAPRTPPRKEAIIGALMEAESGRLVMDRTALLWNATIESHIRRVFQTTYEKAHEWLLAAISAPGSPIVGVRPATGVLFSESMPAPSLAALGWSETVVRDLTFDSSGRLVLPGTRIARTSTYAYLIRRDELEPIRTVLVAQRAKVERERAEAKAAELAEFRALHGDALDVIESIMDRVPAKDYLRDDMIRAHMLSGSGALHQEIYGGDAVLTLTLHAGQIDALAALLRHIPAED